MWTVSLHNINTDKTGLDLSFVGALENNLLGSSPALDRMKLLSSKALPNYIALKFCDFNSSCPLGLDLPGEPMDRRWVLDHSLDHSGRDFVT